VKYTITLAARREKKKQLSGYDSKKYRQMGTNSGNIHHHFFKVPVEYTIIIK
jgi:hypothetical protein